MTRFHTLLGAVTLLILGALAGVGLLVGTGSGSVTDWAGALIGLVGLALTGLGVGYAYMSLMDSRRRDNRADLAQRRAQAEKVTAWGGEGLWRASTPSTVLLQQGKQQVVEHGDGPILLEWADLTAHNASDMPVSGFEFEFYVREDRSENPYVYAGSHAMGVLMPGEQSLRLHPEPDSPLLATMAAVVGTLNGHSERPPQYRVGYAFTDHAGVRWRFDLESKRVEESQ